MIVVFELLSVGAEILQEHFNSYLNDCLNTVHSIKYLCSAAYQFRSPCCTCVCLYIQFTTQPDVAKNYHSLLILLVQFLPSIVIGVLNGLYPVIFGILGKFEGFRPATEVNFQLIRYE